jgi:Type II restriction endonuclease EcoO109I
VLESSSKKSLFAVSAPDDTVDLIATVAAELGVHPGKATEIVAAFERHVAVPLQHNLQRLKGRDLAKRNPMIYTSRGAKTVREWVGRYLEDRETSAIEGHIGTWQEEVARIVSGGFKPGSGVDLQLERDGVIELYAIQSAPNTKSAGGAKADRAALHAAAGSLRASRRPVHLNVAVLAGRSKSTPMRSDTSIMHVGSDDFWERVSGVPDFRARLLRATMRLSELLRGRARSEVDRIHAEADTAFGDGHGNLDLTKLAYPPAATRSRRS